MGDALPTDRDIYVLDIDGTLISTHEIDNACYWQAVEEVFGVGDPDMDLLQYVHVSDSGILDQWCRHALGRAPGAGEIARLQERFLRFLRSVAREQPELFRPRAGLLDWLDTMTARADTLLAIATGSWGVTAAFKLAFSGLDRYGLPVATADDAISRADIMGTALRRLGLPPASERHRVTYVGDGPWDLDASRALGWAFIGIAEGSRARQLRDLGATRVHADFRPLASAAKPPEPS